MQCTAIEVWADNCSASSAHYSIYKWHSIQTEPPVDGNNRIRLHFWTNTCNHNTHSLTTNIGELKPSTILKEGKCQVKNTRKPLHDFRLQFIESFRFEDNVIHTHTTCQHWLIVSFKLAYIDWTTKLDWIHMAKEDEWIQMMRMKTFESNVKFRLK